MKKQPRRFEVIEAKVDFEGRVTKPQKLNFSVAWGAYEMKWEDGGKQSFSSEKLDEIIKAGATWLREIKPERWRVEEGGEYYVVEITEIGKMVIMARDEEGSIQDDRFWEAGNYFQTDKQVSIVSTKIKNLFKTEHELILQAE